jgi:adenylate kinase
MISLEKEINEIGEWLGAGTLNFFGRQFAGKDHMAERLGSHLGVEKISGGDIMRSAAVPDDVRAVMDNGELSPTDIYRLTVLPFLAQTALEGKPLLLSAVGRMKGEEGAVLVTAEESGHPIMAVPYLNITEDEAFRRLVASPSRGRADDTPQGLRKRLDEFNNSTTLVLQTYESRGLVVHIDGMPPKDVVFSGLIHALHERATLS